MLVQKKPPQARAAAGGISRAKKPSRMSDSLSLRMVASFTSCSGFCSPPKLRVMGYDDISACFTFYVLPLQPQLRHIRQLLGIEPGVEQIAELLLADFFG